MSASDGPFFDDLAIGDVFDSAPALTLTEGLAATHQAIVGSRLRLSLDVDLSRRVLGSNAALAHPALVCDVAIGQSSLVTQRVIANLFYRGLILRRAPIIGDTLTTSSEVVGLRRTRDRPGRDARGLAALRIRTVDQELRPVLDFVRCAMLPVREPAGASPRADDLDQIPSKLDLSGALKAVATWRLSEFRDAVGRAGTGDVHPGQRFDVTGGDVVSSAPELARLTLNIAMAHHDATAGREGRRLVYGGHTIGLAAAQALRALPDLVTIVGWHSCDHLGPVFEGDTIRSVLAVEATEPLRREGTLAHLRSRVRAERGGEVTDVLDWRFVAILA